MSRLFLLSGGLVNVIREIYEGIKKAFEPHLTERRIKDVDTWDGSASNYDTTEQYCNACLINLNEGDPEDWTQADCKLPVREQGDSSDTFVRQAVFAAAQRLNQVDAPAEDIQAAARELIRAYNEMDQEPPESLTALAERAISGERLFNALWQRMFDLDAEIEGSDHYLVDMYFDENGFYALYVDRGKLFRYPIQIEDNDVLLGERQEVMEVHQPVETRTVVHRQANGRHRWFSISGTAVLNRGGEIDSRDLFDSCIAYAQETGKYPIRMFYHQGYISRDWEMDASALAYKTGQADFLARDGYCYITSGLYDDTPLAQAEIQARQNNPDFWGDSIGFWPTQEPELVEISDGIRIPVYHEGFNVEITTLPETEAAHLFTRTEVTRMALDGKARDAYIKLWTDAGMTEEDALKWLEDNPAARNRAIEQAGMITRDGGEELNELMTLFKEDKDKALEWLEQHADDPPPEGDPPAGAPQELEIDDSVIEAVSQTILESEGVAQISDDLARAKADLADVSKGQIERDEKFKTLLATVDSLTKRLEALEKGDAAQQQQLNDDAPAKFNGKTKVVYRPRQANAALQEDGTAYSTKAEANLPKGANY